MDPDGDVNTARLVIFPRAELWRLSVEEDAAHRLHEPGQGRSRSTQRQAFGMGCSRLYVLA